MAVSFLTSSIEDVDIGRGDKTELEKSVEVRVFCFRLNRLAKYWFINATLLQKRDSTFPLDIAVVDVVRWEPLVETCDCDLLVNLHNIQFFHSFWHSGDLAQ